jgi:Rieske Fe-S protein
MDGKISNSRRDFLKKMMVGTVITATCPHIVLGKIKPENLTLKDDKLMGLFHIDLNEYPILKEIWGSVKIRVTCVDGSFMDMVVARVTKEACNSDFTAVWELCPHEGQPISLLNPDEKIFICSGHGTIFNSCGTYIDGPAAEDLEKYPTHYDGGDDLYVDHYCYVPSSAVQNIDNLAYLHPGIPNPASDYVRLDYGLEKPAQIKLALYALDGVEVKRIVNNYLGEGHYHASIDVSGLSAGTYLCKMFIGAGRTLLQKIIVER